MRYLLTGDLHGNAAWFEGVVLPAARSADADAVIVLGDFGYWPGRRGSFLDVVARSPLPVYFIDGNHEDHPALAAAVAQVRVDRALAPDAAVPLTGSLIYLPRGSRLLVEGSTLAFLGGARSIDRALRHPGVSWFPEEAISDEDLARLAAGGPCDVLLTHDAPSRVPLPLAPDRDIPAAWLAERPVCAEHRRRLDEACAATRPTWLVHGHYHLRCDSVACFDWGTVRVVSLAEDGSGVFENLALLTVGPGSCAISAIHPR